MAKIVSKRGQAKQDVKPAEVDSSFTEIQIYVYGGRGDQQPLTPEELEHIKRVFETIRRDLDTIHWIH